LIANSKGFSAVIGTVFMVLVMMFLSTSVFLWTLSQNTLYNQELKEKNQVELDRLNERVTASGVNYTGSGDVISVQVVLENNGASAVHITTLWVMDATINKYGFNNTLNLNLKPGDTICLACGNPVDVNITGATATDTFNSWFVTARGNTVPLEEEQSVIVAHLSQGIGSMALDFYAFRYLEYKAGSGDVLENCPDGYVSFNLPINTEVAYGVMLTNLDPRKATIVLDSHSLLWVILPTSDVAHSKWWYIVNVASDGTVSQTYSNISIGYAETKLLFFASEDDLTSSFARQSTPTKSYTVPVFLLLHGEIGGMPYGQNLPFVSLHFS